jgi:hypothetical protein
MDWDHIIQRELLHFGWGGTLYLWSLLGFHYLQRFTKFRVSGIAGFIVPAIVLVFIIFIREPGDVARGSWGAKSYIDLAVWAASVGSMAWLVRWLKRHAWTR